MGIPVGHPLHGIDYSQKLPVFKKDDIVDSEIGKRGIIPLFCAGLSDNEHVSADVYFNVHGGITYSGDSERGYPVKNDDNLWWFGYDCDHYNDAPDPSEMSDSRRASLYYFERNGIIRSLEYCIDECKSLADQLKKLESREVSA